MDTNLLLQILSLLMHMYEVNQDKGASKNITSWRNLLESDQLKAWNDLYRSLENFVVAIDRDLPDDKDFLDDEELSEEYEDGE